MSDVKQMILHYHQMLRGTGGMHGAIVNVFYNGEMMADHRSLLALFPQGHLPLHHALLIHLTGYDFDVDSEMQDLLTLTGHDKACS